jgi:hypothetical protein
VDGGQLGIDLRVTQSFSAYRTVAELFEIGLDDVPFTVFLMELIYISLSLQAYGYADYHSDYRRGKHPVLYRDA